MKQKTKRLTIHVEYNDPKDAIKCIHKIIEDLSIRNFDRQLNNGCLVEWGVELTELPYCHEEIINEKRCIVIPSKMNNNE